MANQVKGQTVIDIGCGSGVLALAAIAMGADRVFAVDIDPEALEHTRRNALLNHMDARIQPSLPQDLRLIDAECVVLINMISSEQCLAWESVKTRLPKVKKIFSSGIRDSAKKRILGVSFAMGMERNSLSGKRAVARIRIRQQLMYMSLWIFHRGSRAL